MKIIITATFFLLSIMLVGQSTTYNNNYGTNYVNGKTGKFNKSSFSWTITKDGGIYRISSDAVSETFNVKYSYYDKENKLYVYSVVGRGYFDGSFVKLVMSSGKLSDYAKGITKDVNLLAILFKDYTGYMYKLNK